MEPVSHTTTTVTTDQRRYKCTAPSGDVYYMTIATKTHETLVETPRDPREPARRQLKTTIRTATLRQLHRVSPYPGARPVRMSSRASTTTEVHERLVLHDGE